MIFILSTILNNITYITNLFEFIFKIINEISIIMLIFNHSHSYLINFHAQNLHLKTFLTLINIYSIKIIDYNVDLAIT